MPPVAITPPAEINAGGPISLRGTKMCQAKIEKFHVVPEFAGEPEHETSVGCWCEPVLEYRDEYTGNEVWVHHRPH